MQIINGRDALTKKGAEWWFQNLCTNLQMIWLAVCWRKYTGVGSTKAKQKHLDGIYARNNTTKYTAQARKTQAYKGFKRSFESTLTAAIRMLLAYETVRCLG